VLNPNFSNSDDKSHLPVTQISTCLASSSSYFTANVRLDRPNFGGTTTSLPFLVFEIVLNRVLRQIKPTC
jgi:hypothetical protein